MELLDDPRTSAVVETEPKRIAADADCLTAIELSPQPAFGLVRWRLRCQPKLLAQHDACGPRQERRRSRIRPDASLHPEWNFQATMQLLKEDERVFITNAASGLVALDHQPVGSSFLR